MSHAISFHLTSSHFLTGLLVMALVFFVWPTNARGQAEELPTIEEKTSGMEAMPGFVNLYWDDATGSLFWKIDELDAEFLYQSPWDPGSEAIRSESTEGSFEGPTSWRSSGSVPVYS